MAKVNINFMGPWRLFLGIRTVAIEVNSTNEARDYIEADYGPVYREKLKSRGIDKIYSIWNNSNILLNGTNIKRSNDQLLKDGDTLVLISIVAGG
jgi:molybdopterin converting factor small subunit